MVPETSQAKTVGLSTGQTRRLARFASELSYNDLPSEVVEQSKICILDALGSSLLGSTMPWGKIMLEYVKNLDGKSESTLIGSGVKVLAGNAALANGTMGHGFEVDDVFIPALHHPGVVVVPAALALAEREGSTGKELIAAVVAGYEVMNRVGKAVGTESHIMRGFFPTGTNGPFGAAASAGKLLRLTEEQIIDALGIAGNHCAGLVEGIKEGRRMTKRLGAGRAALNGIMAADLAKLGFAGPATVIEGDWGYIKAYSDKGDTFPLTEKLGESYNIMETTFKPYPCCKALHAAIDGVLELNNRYRLDPEQVAEVVIGGYDKLVRMHDIYEPPTLTAAQFSMPYVVSVAFCNGRPGLQAFEEPSIRDEKVLAFARKVKIVLDPEIIPYFPENEPSKVTVNMKDGRRYSKTMIHSKGTPQNPMTADEFTAKFKTFASAVISEKQANQAIELILRLDRLGDVKGLSSLLCKEN